MRSGPVSFPDIRKDPDETVGDPGVPNPIGLTSSFRVGPHGVGQATTKASNARVDTQDFLDRCRAGQRDAQRELFERTSTPVYRLLLRMTGNPDDAMDLTQETYVKGLRALGEFDGRSEIGTWLHRIAVNQALQFLRRRRSSALKLRELAPSRPTETQEPTTELRLDLDGAMAELPSEDRAVLLLRYQEALDYRHIAEIMECAEGTVASKLNRARDRLREILGNSYG